MEGGIQLSVSVEVTTVRGLVVGIITVGTVVSLVLFVVFMHSGDVLLEYPNSDLLD